MPSYSGNLLSLCRSHQRCPLRRLQRSRPSILRHQDMASVSTFLRCWAANARGLGFSQPSPLLCTAQSSFPHNPSLPNKLAQLSSTRVNVVTALVWKCFMEAVAEEESGMDEKPFMLTPAVNLRKRALPPFPEDSFGNMVWVPKIVCNSPQEKGLADLVWEVKRGIANIDGEFVRRLGNDGLNEYLEKLRNEMPQQANWLCFSSWVNMGFYEVDFGWGKPVWLSGFFMQHSESETMVLCNGVTLMDSRDGEIEAFALFDQKYVAGFEKNDLIRNYARVNPNVI
ncbi:stemmadenine O-acetyltransferase-like isoform X2 [Salvia hispanica]|uniref:stemmadenine O-acetyltransferase-like isoform X2 n=1 Tax=Salvia hispanica TaxID=49212 RepID=UPI002009DBAB|nr:stemmadenine O-acetyltransferase-like isoform X2 [Salvia hispanica]